MKCDSCKIWSLIIGLILLSFIIAYQFTESPAPDEIRIATGREGGGYHTFALKYQKLMQDHQIQLDIQPTAGSIEVIKRLNAGDVSAGLVQGGTASEVPNEGLQSLASLFYEPLWVFYRKAQPIEYLFDLQGKRVAIGEKGSGTRPLAVQLLQDNDVTQDNTTFLEISSQKSAQQLANGQIDAAFFVMSLTGKVISELLNNPDIELLSFKRATAYSHRYSFLTSVEIGEGMIDLKNNIPSENKTLLATTATLVVREDLHSDLIYLLLLSIHKIHQKGGLLENPKQFPSNQFVDFPMNDEASHYLQYGPSFLQKIFPPWVASLLDRLKILLIPLLAVMLPLLKSALPLYRWGIRFKIFRWYATLREVEQKINITNDLPGIDAEIMQMKAMQKELVGQVSVPLSYMGEFYALRTHIQLVLNQLKERQQELKEQT
jgi:TRAP transporter TAXI family solute receptor